jgi:hypothetical protein
MFGYILSEIGTDGAQMEGLDHNVHIYTLQSTKVYVPSSELRLSHPLSPASVPLPPVPKGGGHTRAGEGLG